MSATNGYHDESSMFLFFITGFDMNTDRGDKLIFIFCNEIITLDKKGTRKMTNSVYLYRFTV